MSQFVNSLLVTNAVRADTVMDPGALEHKVRQLRLALEKKNVAEMDELLNKGCGVNMIDSEGMTSLIYVIQDERENDRLDKVRLLLSKGADVNLMGEKFWNEPPLQVSIAMYRHDVLGALLDAGADINIQCETKLYTPLHLAVEVRNTKAVETLLQRGADVSPVDYAMDTPLHMAAEKCNLDPKLLGCLIKYNADLQALDWDDNTPLERTLTILPLQLELNMKMLLRAGSKCGEKVCRYILDNKTRVHFNYDDQKRIKDMLAMYAFTPRRLQDCACFRIRELLGKALPNAAQCLPVPDALKRQIQLLHVLEEFGCI